MNRQSVIASVPPPDALPRCSHVTAKGRTCRHPVTHRGAVLCSSHARMRPYTQPAANPCADLPPEFCEFSDISHVTKFLARLLVLLSENRISPRRAAVLSYIANSILSSLRAAQRQADSEPQELQIYWTGIPRPERDLIQIAEEQAASSNNRSPNSSHRSESTIPAYQEAPVPPEPSPQQPAAKQAVSMPPAAQTQQPAPEPPIGGQPKPPSKYMSYWDQLKVEREAGRT